jgi:hypothetical protein
MLSMTFSYATWAQQSAPQSAHKLYKMYDTFDGKLIDPSKWRSNDPRPCGSGSALECVREIEGGRLHMRVRNYGATNTDDGTQNANLGVLLTAPLGVMELATEVVVRTASAQGCPNTGAGPRGQAGLLGVWFHAEEGDMNAHVFLETSSDPGVLAVVGHVGVANGPSFGDFPFGEVRVGERVILEMVWDQPHHRFIARLIGHGHSTVAEQYMPYSVPDDTMPPVAQAKGPFLFTYVPNCNGSRPFIEMDTLFDNVSVGQ